MSTPFTEAAEPAPHQLRVTAMQPVAAPGARHLQLSLAQWLVAVVQLPKGPAAQQHAAFAVGANWPPACLPPGCVLLSYLDARDLSLT